MRVRHVPAGKAWHPAKDQLKGTEVYGDPSNDGVAWSIKFDHIKNFKFKFATGDKQLWLIADSSQVFGYYADAKKTILSSSTSAEPYEARWYRRKNNIEDPWISLQDHEYCIINNCFLYGENKYGGQHAKVLSLHDGADVFV